MGRDRDAADKAAIASTVIGRPDNGLGLCPGSDRSPADHTVPYRGKYRVFPSSPRAGVWRDPLAALPPACRP